MHLRRVFAAQISIHEQKTKVVWEHLVPTIYQPCVTENSLAIALHSLLDPVETLSNSFVFVTLGRRPFASMQVCRNVVNILNCM